MASESLSNRLPFLVFPTLCSEYLWKIIAVESNRTISRHKNLALAVEKAERLNIQILSMPAPEYSERFTFLHHLERGHCQIWFSLSGSAVGEQCESLASVSDLDSGYAMCLSCWKAVHRD